MSTGIHANGPRDPAPSASNIPTNTPDLLAALKDAETYAAAAAVVAQFDADATAERIGALIAAAERALAAARNALAEATGTTTASCCAPGPWRYTGNAIESVDHGRWYAVAHVATEHFTPEAIAAHGAILAAAPAMNTALQAIAADYRADLALIGFAIVGTIDADTTEAMHAEHAPVVIASNHLEE